MAVITVSREPGSEGTYIATKVAEALGYHFADKQTMEEVLRQYGLFDFDTVYETVPGLWARFDELRTRTVDMLDRTVKALAEHGNTVVLGRGSFAALRGYPHSLHVRIQAPFEVRVRRVMEREQLADRETAEARVREADRVRTGFVDFAYGVPWNATGAFDVVIDTSKIAPDRAVSWLVAAVRDMEALEPGTTPNEPAAETDTVLQGVVDQVLGCSVSHERASAQTA